MARAARFMWTNNEILAHKKNVGEEVRLRCDLDVINRHMILSTSGMTTELRKVHTELRDVRTSTGHSVAALPPTPFRKHRQPHHVTGSRNNSLLPVSPDSNKLPDIHRLYAGKGKRHADLPYKALVSETSFSPTRGTELVEKDSPSRKPEPCKVDEKFKGFLSRLREGSSSEMSKEINQQTKSTSKKSKRRVSVSLPGLAPILTRERPATPQQSPPAKEGGNEPNTTKEPDELSVSESPRPEFSSLPSHDSGLFDQTLSEDCDKDVESNVPPVDITETPDIGQSSQQASRAMSADNNVLEKEDELPALGNTNEGFLPLPANENTPDSLPVSSLSREISQILDDLREKNRQLLAGRDSLTFKSPANKSLGKWVSKPLMETVPKKLNWTARPLPNTRYRCRTCIERLRDDLRYRQAKRLAGVHPETNTRRESQHFNQSMTPRLSRRSTTLSIASLNLSDHEVKVIGETSPLITKPKAEKARGYSRRRLEKLAEPKAKSRPLKVSGQVLRRQAEALRRPHETWQISEREREQRMKLQSKVRLFLALLQLKRMPNGMVHIPQRDDIMNVDISHVGAG